MRLQLNDRAALHRAVTAFAAGLLMPAIGLAQAASQNALTDAVQDGDICTSMQAASRIRTTCDGERTTIVRTETELTTTVQLRAVSTGFCQGQISLQYEQRNDLAHMEGTLENPTCAASEGEYDVVIRLRADSGDTRTLEFTEQWARSDDQPVRLLADYPIGSDVELIRLNARGLRCRCVEPDAGDAGVP